MFCGTLLTIKVESSFLELGTQRKKSRKKCEREAQDGMGFNLNYEQGFSSTRNLLESFLLQSKLDFFYLNAHYDLVLKLRHLFLVTLKLVPFI